MEEGSNELLEYEFYRDGRLLVSKGGDVSWGNWELTPSSQRLLLTYSDKTLMMHNAFINEALMVLKRSGTTNPSVVFVNQKVIEDLNYRRYLDELNQKKEQELLFQQGKEKRVVFLKAKSKDIGNKLVEAFLTIVFSTYFYLLIPFTIGFIFSYVFINDVYNIFDSIQYDYRQYQSFSVSDYSRRAGACGVIFGFSVSATIYYLRKCGRHPILKNLFKTAKLSVVTITILFFLVLPFVLAFINRAILKNDISEIMVEMQSQKRDNSNQ